MSGGAEATVDFPSLTALLLIGLGLGSRWGRPVAKVNLVSCALAPTSLYMVLRNWGPPTLVWLDAPDQGTGLRSDWTVGPSRI